MIQASSIETPNSCASRWISLLTMKKLRQWINQIDIQNAETARSLCRLIPSQCPFERDLFLFGHKVAHIPPLCKLNPFYEELVGLRFRALCYLADQCQEDVRAYL